MDMSFSNFEYRAGDVLMCVSNPHQEQELIIRDTYEVLGATRYGEEVVYALKIKDSGLVYSTGDKFKLVGTDSERFRISCPVIECGNCGYYITDDEHFKKGEGFCEFWWADVDASDFCSHAK